MESRSIGAFVMLGLVLTAVTCSAAAAPAASPLLTSAEISQAEAGGVPVRYEAFTTEEGRSAGRGIGAIVVERPASEAWTTVSRYEDKAEYAPRLKRITVLEKKPDALRCRMEVEAFFKIVRYTAWYRLDPGARRIHWKLDRSAADNQVSDVEGEWTVAELGPNRALLTYWTYVNAGAMIPDFARKRFTLKSIPELLRAVKNRVESGGTWRKP